MSAASDDSAIRIPYDEPWTPESPLPQAADPYSEDPYFPDPYA